MPEPTHLTDYLARNARECADKPALITNTRTLTWAELNDAVLAAASNLPVANDEQHIIGLLLPNSWEFMVCYLAIVHSGHIAMPLDPNYKLMEITSVLEGMKPEFSITNTASKQYFPEGETVLDSETLLDKPLHEGMSYLRLPADQQYASMLFTSGTTGKPKSTPYTHRNYIWNVEAVTDLWEWTADDTLLISLPLSHWHGLAMGVVGSLRNTNTIYLHERFDPEETLKALDSGDISMFMHVPIAYLKITQHKPSKKYDLSKVRLCVSGSSYLPPRVWQDFKDQYGHDILERYGASEMGLLASNRLDERVPGSVGYPLPGVELRLEKDGEIAMRSPGLFRGYWGNEAATKEKTAPDGFWLSGDIGELDDNGRLTLKGRVQEKMKKFGYTIYPRDLEWALLKSPDVDDVFVLSVQNAGQDGMSDLIVYFVVGKADEQAVTDFCKANMPSFWRPDKIVKLDEIPKSPAGKPKLAKLREMITEA